MFPFDPIRFRWYDLPLHPLRGWSYNETVAEFAGIQGCFARILTNSATFSFAERKNSAWEGTVWR